MPYKANADRRHKFPRAKYQVTNWPEYDAALIRRGSLTVWVTDEAMARTGDRKARRSTDLFRSGYRDRTGVAAGSSPQITPN